MAKTSQEFGTSSQKLHLLNTASYFRSLVQIPKALSMNNIVSLETLFEKFSQKKGLIIDVREKYEFAKAHIPGSINIPSSLMIQSYKSIPAGSEVYVVCTEGVKSLGMAQFLKLKRIKAHAVSPGGIDEWNEMGLPLNQ